MQKSYGAHQLLPPGFVFHHELAIATTIVAIYGRGRNYLSKLLINTEIALYVGYVGLVM